MTGLPSALIFFIDGRGHGGDTVGYGLFKAIDLKLELNEKEIKLNERSGGIKMPGTQERYVIRPIGVVRVEEEDEVVKTSLDGVRGVVEIFEEYKRGLEGIEGFSHLILAAYLNKVKDEERATLMVKPRRFIRFGVDPALIPTVGVFCTDSPHRPNPIAITIVRLLKVEGRSLHVDGLDLFDSTPIVDIKPYTKARVEGDLNIPKWYSELLQKVKDKRLEEYDL